MRVVLAAVALAGVLAASAAGGDYRKAAQALMPTPAQAGFEQLLQFTKAKRPKASLARGWQAGVAAIYQKGTTKAPVEAAATASVYATAADAKRAWQNACPACQHVLVNGIQMRYVARKVNGATAFQAYMYCHNVYTAVVAAGSESAAKLGNDVGVISGAIYRRAIHFGMSACK